MSFTDLFKNSVVEGFTNADISLSKILVTLGITVVLALYIFAIYRLATKSVFYSKGFAISMRPSPSSPRPSSSPCSPTW